MNSELLKVSGIVKDEKIICVYNIKKRDDGKYDAYDKHGHSELTKAMLDSSKKSPVSFPMLLIPYEKDKHHPTIESFYEYVIKCADALKIASKGKINMYKSGRFSKTATHLLYSFLNKTDIRPEPIDNDTEARFLLNCKGAFHLARKYEGELHHYDFNSYYSYIYASAHLRIPVKKGILKTITQSDFDEMKWPEFGVYRAVVEDIKGNNRFLFTVVDSNYYTSDELAYAKKLNLTVRILEEKDNFLHYPASHCRTGYQIFNEYVQYVYALKKKGVPGSKDLLNQLWGYLIRSTQVDIDVNHDNEEECEVDPNFWTVINHTILDDKRTRITMIWKNQIFKESLARMKPFFMAKQRITMAKTIEPYIDHVYYSNTDSIMSDIELPLKIGDKIGQLKYFGCDKNGWVKNANSRSNNFKLP